MKKLLKVFALVAVVACCAMVVAFAGCKKDNGTSYVGEYHYNASNTEYGIKVSVVVEDNVIKSVKVLDSDYTSVTTGFTIDGVWDETNIANWNDNLNTLLGKYVGKTVDEILAIDVATTDNVPDSNQTFEGLVITGATQGSGRLLLAVQNAIKDLASAN